MLRFSLLVALCLSSGFVFAFNYTWFTDVETRPLGNDNDYQPFDSTGLSGIIRSNDTITIAYDGIFGQIITSAPGFIQGPEYDPTFYEPPVFSAQPLPLTDLPENIRQCATHYYNPGNDKQMRIRIIGSIADVFTWDLGEAFDSLTANHNQIPIAGYEKCIFTETPLELMGFDITGRVTIASAQVVRLMNDVRVGGPTSGPPQYRVSPGNSNYVGIVSEGQIKIANTPANGRGNSNGLGFEQMNPALTDIVINAQLFALGGFTFEQQNDADSGYVCNCSPDDRGNIYLYGAITQGQRGYLSRTNNGRTGYLLQLRFDSRLLQHSPPCFISQTDSTHAEPDTLYFGDVAINQTATDTVLITVTDYSTLGMATATPPYVADPELPAFGTHFAIPVHFTPPSVGSFNGVLQVTTSFDYFEIPLRGHGVLANAADEEYAAVLSEPLILPNPFNAIATLTFGLSCAEHVTIELFDVLGRRVATLADDQYTSGAHHIAINGAPLTSGLYFVRLNSKSWQQTHKLLLIK